MRAMVRYFFLLLWLIIGLTACGVRDLTPPSLPTVMPMEAAATAFALTENAPPAGFDSVAFPRIDAGLHLLAGWRYEVALSFDGVFSRTPRTVAAMTQAEVSFNQVASARRVLTTIDNDIQAASDPVRYEAVRLGPDTFLVRDGICLSNAGEDAAIAADFSAGALVGGIQQAQTAAQKAVINGEEVWRYAFTTDNIIFSGIQLTENSRILSLAGELWVSPKHQIVIRYYLSADVENVLLFDTELPVTGSVRIRYDVYEVGVVPNLSVPFGC